MCPRTRSGAARALLGPKRRLIATCNRTRHSEQQPAREAGRADSPRPEGMDILRSETAVFHRWVLGPPHKRGLAHCARKASVVPMLKQQHHGRHRPFKCTTTPAERNAGWRARTHALCFAGAPPVRVIVAGVALRVDRRLHLGKSSDPRPRDRERSRKTRRRYRARATYHAHQLAISMLKDTPLAHTCIRRDMYLSK